MGERGLRSSKGSEIRQHQNSTKSEAVRQLMNYLKVDGLTRALTRQLFFSQLLLVFREVFLVFLVFLSFS